MDLATILLLFLSIDLQGCLSQTGRTKQVAKLFIFFTSLPIEQLAQMVVDKVDCPLVERASRAFHQLTSLLIVSDGDLSRAEDEATKLDLVLLLQLILGQVLVIHAVSWAQKFTPILHIMYIVVLAQERAI